jgi:6-phosphofructokinase 1
MKRIAQRIGRGIQNGRRHAIVLVCEGVATADGHPATPALAKYLAAFFANSTEPLKSIETRCSVLGHLQRGGSPSAADCLLAARFAEAAWNEIVSHDKSGVVGVRNGELMLTPFDAVENATVTRRREQDYQLQKDITRPFEHFDPSL